MFELLIHPNAWIAFASLTALELVLRIITFKAREVARKIGRRAFMRLFASTCRALGIEHPGYAPSDNLQRDHV